MMMSHPQHLKEAMACFGTGVTVITATHAGQDFGMTCNSFNTVSLEPALVLWSIRQSSGNRTHFESAGGYTVNILSHAQQPLALHFTKGSQAERFAGLHLARLASGRPQIVGSTAWFDCALERIIPAGDHDIMLGRVLDFGFNPDASTEPLIYARRQFGKLISTPSPVTNAA
ncbi:MAG: flavin reductase family protein [Cytophagales bacterium]|nr:flavin reductase family protein [Cytophagales bacterium]